MFCWNALLVGMCRCGHCLCERVRMLKVIARITSAFCTLKILNKTFPFVIDKTWTETTIITCLKQK